MQSLGDRPPNVEGNPGSRYRQRLKGQAIPDIFTIESKLPPHTHTHTRAHTHTRTYTYIYILIRIIKVGTLTGNTYLRSPSSGSLARGS